MDLTMDTRQVNCPVCGILLVEITLPSDTTEEQWAHVMSAYKHTNLVCNPDLDG